MNYYNDNDPKACAWLAELMTEGLIAKGEIDQRSIVDVRPGDLRGFVQCHFFAGIGGWPYALRLAGCPEDREVWTGSCPCQPLSCAGKGKGDADERHLWPAFYRLISECRPGVVLGEQVTSKIGREWLCGVRADMEGIGYAFGAVALCAYAVKSPHKRLRTYWIANSPSSGRKGIQPCSAPQVQKNRTPEALDPWHGTGNPFEHWEKLLAGTCIHMLDDGVSSNMVVRPALRGFGNSIVPQVAKEFIQVVMECL